MKNLSSKLIATGFLLAIGSACSSMPGSNSTSAKDLAVNGPSIINARTVPETIELSTDLRPQQPAEILADVKDFNSQISDVKLRFLHAPIEVPMRNIGGTTWRATLTNSQLRMLAVSGKTMSYDAQIIAQNANGQSSTTQNPVEVQIKTPDLSTFPTG
jgi:hypothetical protein